MSRPAPQMKGTSFTDVAEVVPPIIFLSIPTIHK